MTAHQALTEIEKLMAVKTRRKDVRERLAKCKKAVTKWNVIPEREIELLSGILFTEGVDVQDASENSEHE